MGYSGIIKSMQNNLSLRRRYRNAYRKRLIELHHPKDDKHSYHTSKEIKEAKERLRKKISLGIKHNIIIGIIGLVITCLLIITYINPRFLFP